MDKLKLVMACAALGVIIYQVQLMGGKAQRQYYTGANVIAQRQAAAAADTLPAAPTGDAGQGNFCSGGSCRKPAMNPQQAEADALRAQMEEQKKKMEEQAELLRKMQEQLDAMNSNQTDDDNA